MRFFLFMFPMQFCLNFSKIIMKKFCRTAKCENFDDFCELLLKKIYFSFFIQALKKNEALKNFQFYFSLLHFFSQIRIFALWSDTRLLAPSIGRFLRCHLRNFWISTAIFAILDKFSDFAGPKLLRLKRSEVSHIFKKKVCAKICTTKKVMTEKRSKISEF